MATLLAARAVMATLLAARAVMAFELVAIAPIAPLLVASAFIASGDESTSSKLCRLLASRRYASSSAPVIDSSGATASGVMASKRFTAS